VHVKKIALPLYPQLGLEPNVYYIPPVHVPIPHLEQLFGPGVDRAIELYRTAKDDPELLGLLLLFGSTERIITTFDVKGGVARGYDENGAEIVAVPLREPSFVRPFEFATEAAGEQLTGYRHNT
jgi:nitrate reductase beta subunit